jgi:hypothetical protein
VSTPDRTFVRHDFRSVEALKPPAGAIGPERRFTIEQQAWLAFEAADPVTRERTLIFIGPGTARRVREYPANWRDLSDIELYSLSWGR